MPNAQRRVIHELAEFYGCQTESYDEEPNKNVVATAVRCVHIFLAYLHKFIAYVLIIIIIIIDPLIATLKPQSNGPWYSDTVIGTLAVDGWAVTFGTTRRGLGGAAAHPGPSSLYKM